MIVRTWVAHTTPDRESAYLEKAKQIALPHLQSVEGYLGAHFLKRPVDNKLEILVITYWESIQALKSLTGDDLAGVYLPSEIASTLVSYDNEAFNYDCIIDDCVTSKADLE